MPKVNIVLKKYKEEGEEFFNPTSFLEEFYFEKYFEQLKNWRLKNQETYLNKPPYLLMLSHRDKKCLTKAPRLTIRG